MFDHRRAAAGVAVLSGMAAASLGAGAAPADAAAQADPAPPPDRFCAVAAVSADEYVPGRASAMVCGPTSEEAHARLRAANPLRPPRTGTFAAAQAFQAGDRLLGIEYEREDGGPSGRRWDIWHPTCDAMYNAAYGWEYMIKATELVSCAVTKLYKGRDATGENTGPVRNKTGINGLAKDFQNKIRSVTFGSS